MRVSAKIIMVFLAVFVCFHFFGFISSVHAATFTVDSTGDESDTSAGNGVCDIGDGSCTLRAAIEETNAGGGGDTISIGAIGTTTPAVAFPQISASTTIAGPGDNGFVIDGVNTTNADGLVVNNTGVTILGLTVKNFDWNGISCPPGTGKNCLITNNIVVDNGKYGLSFFRASNDGENQGIVISNNTVSGSGWSGIGVHQADNILISGNTTFSNTGSGISVQDSNEVSISSNTSTLNTQNGIYLFAATSTVISDNVITSNTQDGVLFYYSPSVQVTSNTISSNMSMGVSLNSYSDNGIISGNIINTNAIGVLVQSYSNNSIISGNTINDSNAFAGIYIHMFSNGSTVSGNNINGSAPGFDCVQLLGTEDTQVLNNTLSNCNQDGISIHQNESYGTGPDNNILSGNTITSVGRHGIYVGESGNVFNTLVSDNIINLSNNDSIKVLNAASTTISSNTLYSNLNNGINLNTSGRNQIISNIIYDHSTTSEAVWTATVSPLKYGATEYNEHWGICGGNPAVGYYEVGTDEWNWVCEGNATVSATFEAEASSAGGIDSIIFMIDVGLGLQRVTAFTAKGVFGGLASLEGLLSGMGGDAKAYIHNIMTKTGSMWTYNGIVDGVNGVMVEEDGDGVSLADAEPSLVYMVTYAYSAVYLSAVTSTSFASNTFYNNGNGIIFTGASDGNIVNGGVIISSLGYDIQSSASGTNTLSNLSFDYSKVNITDGQIDVYYDVRARVRDIYGIPILGATTSLLNANSNTTSLGITDVDGFTDYASVNAFNLNTEGYAANNNPHTLVVSAESYETAESTTAINSQNQTINLNLYLTCTNFTYSDWGGCSSNSVQTRSVLDSFPSGCTGGTPLLSQFCNYIPSGGGAFIPTPSVGVGLHDVFIPMYEQKEIVGIGNNGLNILAYIGSIGAFNIATSKAGTTTEHVFTILDLDIAKKTIILEIRSESIATELRVREGDSAYIDLDNDGVDDMYLYFNKLLKNRIDLTIKQTDFNNKFDKKLESAETRFSDSTFCTVFTRDLKTGDIGEDVIFLQRYLNNNGFMLADSGPGSPGNETAKFGGLTRRALIKFQKANDIKPAVGYFGSITREYLQCLKMKNSSAGTAPIETEIFAYGRPRISLQTEKKLAKTLADYLGTTIGKVEYNKIFWSNVRKTKQWWYNYINAYVYGGYTLEEIRQSIELGSDVVNFAIPASIWRN